MGVKRPAWQSGSGLEAVALSTSRVEPAGASPVMRSRDGSPVGGADSVREKVFQVPLEVTRSLARSAVLLLPGAGAHEPSRPAV